MHTGPHTGTKYTLTHTYTGQIIRDRGVMEGRCLLSVFRGQGSPQ